MNWPIALPVALISSLIRLCSSSGILQVMPFCSFLFSLLFHWVSPFGQHKHTPNRPQKLSPTLINLQGKKPSQTSQPTMPKNRLKRNKYPPAKRGDISVSGKALKLQATHKVRFLLACQPRIGLLATRKRVSGIVKTYLVTFTICL